MIVDAVRLPRKKFPKRISLATFVFNYFVPQSDSLKTQILCQIFEATLLRRLQTGEDQPWVEVDIDPASCHAEIDSLASQPAIIETRTEGDRLMFRLREQWFTGVYEL